VFAKAMADAGNRSQVAFAETGTLPYLVRKHGASDLVISGYATRLPTGVFPSNLSEHAFAVLREAYPSVEPIEDALSGALMNAGPIIHPPLIMMNAGPLEHFEAWDIHNEGTQPSIRRVTNQLDAERMAVREALTYDAPHFPLADHYNTPVAQGLLSIASVVAGRDLYAEGRTLENLGLVTLSRAQMTELLTKGYN
jgi:opine dehydrogenase